MSTRHMYFPAPGQTDAAERAAALDVDLVPEVLYNDLRYNTRITTRPCVVCDHGDEIVVIPEPTTLAAITVAHDALLEEHVPTTVPHLTDVVAQIGTSMTSGLATHSAAANPHNITPAGIGAAATSHSHVDVDLPAGLARDAEVAAGYAALTHTHAIPTAGAIRKTGNQTMTATSQTAITDMAFAVAANATYYFQMELVITTSTGTAPITAFGFTGPASPTAVGIAMTQDTSTSVQIDAVIASFTSFAAGAQVANTGAKFCGVIQTAGTAGTVQLTAARGGTTPSMVVAAGSNGFWMRVA